VLLSKRKEQTRKGPPIIEVAIDQYANIKSHAIEVARYEFDSTNQWLVAPNSRYQLISKLETVIATNWKNKEPAPRGSELVRGFRNTSRHVVLGLIKPGAAQRRTHAPLFLLPPPSSSLYPKLLPSNTFGKPFVLGDCLFEPDVCTSHADLR
jgi:hypothetical protein